MPNVAAMIREHVTLEMSAATGSTSTRYVSRLQSSGRVVTFLARARGRPIPSPAVFGQITEGFETRLCTWRERRGIP